MRWLLCSLLVVTLVSFAAPEAWAHGGGSFRGPGSGSVPPGIRDPSDPTPPPPPPPSGPTFCECGCADCATCMTEEVRNGSLLSTCSATPEEIERWGAVRLVRTQFCFQAKQDVERTEGYVRVTQGTICAVSSVEFTGIKHLRAKEVGAAKAGPDYMRTMRKIIDPVLYMRRGAAQFDLRVFPVVNERTSTAVVEMYVLANEACTRIELYRSTDHVMALVPLAAVRPGGAQVVDLENGRAVYFLSAKEAEAHAFFGAHLPSARSVPCVAPLKDALLKGNDEAWVGTDDEPTPTRRGFRGPGGDVPPSTREPQDPPPPAASAATETESPTEATEATDA